MVTVDELVIQDDCVEGMTYIKEEEVGEHEGRFPIHTYLELLALVLTLHGPK